VAGQALTWMRDAIKSGGFSAVCFTSSSTVRNLVGIAGKPHNRTVVACIGPATAATAAEFGLRVDVQPETASIPALIDALAEFAQRRAEEEQEKAAAAPTRLPSRVRGSTTIRPGRLAADRSGSAPRIWRSPGCCSSPAGRQTSGEPGRAEGTQAQARAC